MCTQYTAIFHTLWSNQIEWRVYTHQSIEKLPKHVDLRFKSVPNSIYQCLRNKKLLHAFEWVKSSYYYPNIHWGRIKAGKMKWWLLIDFYIINIDLPKQRELLLQLWNYPCFMTWNVGHSVNNTFTKHKHFKPLANYLQRFEKLTDGATFSQHI